MYLQSKTAQNDFPRCPDTCRNDPDEAARVGCRQAVPDDQPAPFEIGCFECRGRSDVCDVCDGKHRIEIRVCPHRLAHGARETFALRTYTFLTGQGGTLPFGGGWADLPVSLFRAVEFIAEEKSAIDEEAKGGE